MREHRSLLVAFTLAAFRHLFGHPPLMEGFGNVLSRSRVSLAPLHHVGPSPHNLQPPDHLPQTVETRLRLTTSSHADFSVRVPENSGESLGHRPAEETASSCPPQEAGSKASFFSSSSIAPERLMGGDPAPAPSFVPST